MEHSRHTQPEDPTEHTTKMPVMAYSLATEPETPPNPRPSVTRGLEASRWGTYAVACASFGFLVCAGYVYYKYGDPSQDRSPKAAPTITMFISPSASKPRATESAHPSAAPTTWSYSPSASPSAVRTSASPSPSLTSASASPSEAIGITPTITPSVSESSPAAPTENACQPPQGAYEICEVGTSAYSYPDTSRGHVVYTFGRPTQVAPECQNQEGWMLVDFANPGGAQAGYVHTSAVTGNVGNVAICN